MVYQTVAVGVNEADLRKLINAYQRKTGTSVMVSASGNVPLSLKKSDIKRIANSKRGRVKVTLSKQAVQESVMNGEGFFDDLWKGIKTVAKPIASVARLFSPILKPAIGALGTYYGGPVGGMAATAGTDVVDTLLKQVGIGLRDPRVSQANKKKAVKALEQAGGALFLGQRGAGAGCSCGGALYL